MGLWQRLGSVFKNDRQASKPLQRDPKVVVRVLMVCLGNLCRSPTAEAVLAHHAVQAGLGRVIEIDSCGLSASNRGEPPDRRAREAAARRGYSMDDLRTRRFDRDDLNYFEYVIAMDREVLETLQGYCMTPVQDAKLHLLLDYAPQLPEREVPDPYFGGRSGFERVLDLIEPAATGLLAHLRREYRL